MSFATQATLAADATFKSKISIAIAQAAVAVQAEDQNALAVPVGYANRGSKQNLHDLRASLAHRILNDIATYTVIFAWAVACDPNIAGISNSSTDADLLFTVNAVYNAVAIG